MQLSDLQYYVRHRLTVGTDDDEFDDQITVLLNQNYKRIVLQEELAVLGVPIDFAAGVATFDLPADCGRVQNIQLAGGGKLLESVSRRELAEINASNLGAPSDGTNPAFYALEPPTKVRIEPAPSASKANAATLWYVQRPPDMVAPTDEPEWLLEEFHELLGELTIIRMAATEEEVSLAAEARVNATELMDQLKRATAKRQARPGSRPAVLGYDRAV
jgi:hypothetical protein